MRIQLPALLALGLLAGPATAQDSVVIYRCTDATGAVSVQNDIPCPKGSQQQRRVIETVYPPSPPPAASQPVSSQPGLPPQAAVPTVTPVLEIVDSQSGNPSAAADHSNQSGSESGDTQPAAEPQPPPPLFSCRTWNRETLLTDDPVPAQRCAPLTTTGLDGNPAAGAGVACDIRQDICEPVPADQLCEQWRQYLNDKEALLQFGRAPDPVIARAESERIGAIVQANDCSR